ncbi:MAG TPA: hypothetical protein VJH92_05285 [Candidatus Nanoarchaeia archaeon]|nr:hypothetical protein [Candidatus Nanoarchaeia archaeon]
MSLLQKIGRELNPLNDGVNEWYNHSPIGAPFKDFASHMIKATPHIFRDYGKSAIRGGIVGTAAGYVGNKLGVWDINPIMLGETTALLDMLQYFTRKVIQDLVYRIPNKEPN